MHNIKNYFQLFNLNLFSTTILALIWKSLAFNSISLKDIFIFFFAKSCSIFLITKLYSFSLKLITLLMYSRFLLSFNSKIEVTHSPKNLFLKAIEFNFCFFWKSFFFLFSITFSLKIRSLHWWKTSIHFYSVCYLLNVVIMNVVKLTKSKCWL